MTAKKSTVADLTATSIYDASTSDILAFGKEKCGLEFAEGANREYMVRQVIESMSWQMQKPEDSATHAIVTIARSPEDGGDRPARLGFNGKMLTIKREIQVEIPIGFYNVIMDANARAYKLRTDIDGDTPTTKRIQASVYPVQLHGFVNKGEEKKKSK